MKEKMRSRFPNTLVLLADIIITVVAIVAAFALRLEGDQVSDYIGSALLDDPYRRSDQTRRLLSLRPLPSPVGLCQHK